VHIYDYPGHEIVKDLGIRAVPLTEESAGFGYTTQSVLAFSVRATVTEELAQRLLRRAGTQEWTIYPEEACRPLLDEKKKRSLEADQLMEGLDPSRVADVLFQIQFRAIKRKDKVSEDMARSAMDATDPQAIIESMFNGEWSGARWWRLMARTIGKSLGSVRKRQRDE
jgi:hypothetical protein